MTTTVLLIVGLVLAALFLLLMEFVTPSFGILTGMGVAAAAGAAYVAFTQSATLGTILVTAFVLGIPVYLYMLVKLLPNTLVGRHVFLRSSGEDPHAAATPEVEQLKALIGREGPAETDLRPSGAIRIDGRRIIAIAESGMIDKGSTVRVVRVSGGDAVVRAVEPGGVSGPPGRNML